MKRGQIVAVCGAPGAGKSELLRYLVDQLVLWIVVDLDEILEADGTLLGVQVGASAGEANWPGYEALWSRISDMMTRSGHSVVVLSQIPSVEGLSDLRVRSPVHSLGLPRRSPTSAASSARLVRRSNRGVC